MWDMDKDEGVASYAVSEGGKSYVPGSTRRCYYSHSRKGRRLTSTKRTSINVYAYELCQALCIEYAQD